MPLIASLVQGSGFRVQGLPFGIVGMESALSTLAGSSGPLVIKQLKTAGSNGLNVSIKAYRTSHLMSIGPGYIKFMPMISGWRL
jgi:hypothetical protein